MVYVKNILVAITSSISKPFYFLTSLASLIGLAVVFFNNTHAVIVALAFFCFMLVIFTSYLLYAIFRTISHNDITYEFDCFSSFYTYETNDSNIIKYDVVRVIQCKKAIMTEFHQPFKWSGTITPKFSSDLQELNGNIANQLDRYDIAILKFKSPLYYNKSATIHLQANIDDTDHKSKTHLSVNITRPNDLIHFRIILKYKEDKYNARAILEKKKKGADLSVDFKLEKEIAFDNQTKSYEYYLLNPDVGYIYRIRWAR